MSDEQQTVETAISHEHGRRFEPTSGEVIAAALAVHCELGPGFLEAIYHNAMCVALSHRTIPFETQKPIPVFFEGSEVGLQKLDLVVKEEIVVELKAVKALEEIHKAQLRSYLRASNLKVGLLLNFNAPYHQAHCQLTRLLPLSCFRLFVFS